MATLTLVPALLCSAMIFTLAIGAENVMAQTTSPTTQAGGAPLIVLAGDSGVTDDHGWGKGFAGKVINGAKCENLSASGRSSKSFRDEKFWEKVMASHATYILINFGGNDQPGKGDARETDPNTTYSENIARYVDEARSIGATPIIIAPMCRRFFSADGKIARSSLQPYVDALKVVAEKKKVPLINLHQMSIDYFNQVGVAVCVKEYSPATAAGKLDRSHLTAKGGDVVGKLVVDDLAVKVPALAPYLKTN